MNVLISNVGRRGYLVRYLKSTTQFEGKVFVSDCDPTASGLYGENDGAFILPRPVDDENDYVKRLIGLCHNNNVGVVIPVIDPEIFILSRYRALFKQEGIFVAVSSDGVLDICYNKLLMNDFLDKNGFNIPITLCSIDELKTGLDRAQIGFPVIIKPIYGSGSESTYKVNSIEEAIALFREGMIIQECIDGQEYGVDTFNNLNGEPIRCVVKRKISMRNGETDKAESVCKPEIRDLMIDLARKLGHICNLDSDVLERNNELYVIDLNPRFGGGYPATHEAGINLINLVNELALGKDIAPAFDNYNLGVYTFKEISLCTTQRLIV